MNNLNSSHLRQKQDLNYYQPHNKRKKINISIGKLIIHQHGIIKVRITQIIQLIEILIIRNFSQNIQMIS